MRIFILCLFVLSFVFFCGCEEAKLINTDNGTVVKIDHKNIFKPAKIKFTQLTEFVESYHITAYIDVTDQFGSRIKAPGLWRFELYEYVKRSSDSTGNRIYLWDDIELTDAKKNNDHWQDFMRSYKFELGFDTPQAEGKTYILQAVCFTAEGKRLTDSIELRL